MKTKKGNSLHYMYVLLEEKLDDLPLYRMEESLVEKLKAASSAIADFEHLGNQMSIKDFMKVTKAIKTTAKALDWVAHEYDPVFITADALYALGILERIQRIMIKELGFTV